MSEDLESLYQRAQKYLKKNAFDLEIPEVANAVGLASSQIRTQCRNFWTSACEVSHASFRINIANEYGEFTFDNVERTEIYACDGYWAANFLVATPRKPLTEFEILELEKETGRQLADVAKRQALEGKKRKVHYTAPTWEELLRRKRMTFEERDAERQANLFLAEKQAELEAIERMRVVSEQSLLEYESRLTVVGGTRLWKIAKVPVNDAKWIKELALAMSGRYVSFFDANVKVRWDVSYLHDPIPDPYLDPPHAIESTLIKKKGESLEKLNSFFYGG
jgi:hypothetical protein